MVHSSKEYSDTHIDDNRDQVMQHLIAETSRTIDCDVGTAVIPTFTVGDMR